MAQQIQFVLNAENHPVLVRTLSTRATYNDLRVAISSAFPSMANFDVSYRDEEGDYIKITTDLEFKEALHVAARDGYSLMLQIQESAKPSEKEIPSPAASEVEENPLKPLANAFCKFFGLNSEIHSAIDELCDNVPQIVSQIEEIVQNPGNNEVSEFIKAGFDSVQKEIKQAFPQSSPVSVAVPIPAPKSPEPEIVLKKEAAPVVHPARCDSCNLQIVGIRYKCLSCPDYDLCDSCESENTDGQIHKDHCFAKLRTLKQQVCNQEFRGFHHRGGLFRARAHHRLNTLEEEVSELKNLVAQLVKQRAEQAESEHVEQPTSVKEPEQEEVVCEQEYVYRYEPEPELEVAPEPEVEEENPDKVAAFNTLSEMGIEINSAIELLLEENHYDVERVLSSIWEF